VLALSVDVDMPGDLPGLEAAQVQTKEDREKKKKKKRTTKLWHLQWYEMEQFPIRNLMPAVADLHF
jgi:hypothetical protein